MLLENIVSISIFPLFKISVGISSDPSAFLILTWLIACSTSNFVLSGPFQGITILHFGTRIIVEQVLNILLPGFYQKYFQNCSSRCFELLLWLFLCTLIFFYFLKFFAGPGFRSLFTFLPYIPVCEYHGTFQCLYF